MYIYGGMFFIVCSKAGVEHIVVTFSLLYSHMSRWQLLGIDFILCLSSLVEIWQMPLSAVA